MASERPRIAVLMTLDSKAEVARFVVEAVIAAGAEPWVMDLSLRDHDRTPEGISAVRAMDTASDEFAAISKMTRAEATEKMIEAATPVLLDAFQTEGLSGVIGVGGANGSTMACGMMRALAPMVPKAMVTPVAATAAVQWYVAQSDIAMYPTIGDINLNRITRAIIENAAHAVTGMSRAQIERRARTEAATPLIGISTFGNLQSAVDRMTASLEAGGSEVIHFHSSGPGGKALESLTRTGELAGLIDLTTSELVDFINGGVYSAGPERMTAAAELGLAQVVVPGCLDFTNWWVGEVPEKFQDREFYRYNQEILLMRTNAGEFAELAKMFVDRLAPAAGPYVVLIPTRGFSQMTAFPTQDIATKEVGAWAQPACDAVFTDAVKSGLPADRVIEVDLHINDPAFADRAVAELARLGVAAA